MKFHRNKYIITLIFRAPRRQTQARLAFYSYKIPADNAESTLPISNFNSTSCAYEGTGNQVGNLDIQNSSPLNLQDKFFDAFSSTLLLFPNPVSDLCTVPWAAKSSCPAFQPHQRPLPSTVITVDLANHSAHVVDCGPVFYSRL